MYRIRVILDSEEDVIRDIDISEKVNLLELHKQIIKAFDFEEGELASFYASNEDWEQGEEISLLDFGGMPGMEAKLMAETPLTEFLKEIGSKMIYVYDLLNLWTFYVDLLQTDIPELEEVRILKIVGDRPKEAPNKSMEATNLEDEFEEENFTEENSDEDPYNLF